MAKSCLRMNPFKQRKHINVMGIYIKRKHVKKITTTNMFLFIQNTFIINISKIHFHITHEHGHIKGSSIKLKWGFKT